MLDGRSVIVAASYEGTILAFDYRGHMLWDKPNPLTGYMVRDLWCGDLDRDGNDEILAAVSDGSIHCLSLADGAPHWAKPFQPNEVPMNAVCTIRGPNATYVACGGFDKNIYYLDKDGKLLETIPSSTYSDLRPWGKERVYGYGHVANFMRPVPQPDGTDHLLLLGMHNHMQVSGRLYEFEPLAAKPFRKFRIPYNRSIGYLSVVDTRYVLLGSSTLSDQCAVEIDLRTGASRVYQLKRIGPNGYRVTQTEVVSFGKSHRYFFLCGNYAILLPPNFDEAKRETVVGRWAFNDMWRDRSNNRILLASAQSGGSAIHILDTSNPDWKSAFSKLDPPGKIQVMKANLSALRSQLRHFKRPPWERPPDPVLITAAPLSHPLAQKMIRRGYNSLIFLSTKRSCRWNLVQSRDWRDKSGIGIENEKYRKRRDKRMPYVLSQEEAVRSFLPGFEEPGAQGISMWAGHGNDPYYYQPSIYRKIIDAANGKYTVMVWPELGGHAPEFAYVLNHLFYPLAEYCQPRRGRIVFRSKNIFWQSTVYLPWWRRFLSGEFKDVFISSMEETTDKTQDMSLAGRIGLWASGVTGIWGMRCSRDNPCFDRSRQHAYQRLADHFLRTTVYSLAYGARYTQNTYTDVETLSLYWELIATGALFIPRREEIVSFSPVHLSITDPDERYTQEGTNNKWTIFYDPEKEAANPMVFSRMNGTWMAARPTPWDYSTIAFGAKERRQTFIPTFDKGLVNVVNLSHPANPGYEECARPDEGADAPTNLKLMTLRVWSSSRRSRTAFTPRARSIARSSPTTCIRSTATS